MFSTHTLMAGGRFKISKYTGQRDIDEDLKGEHHRLTGIMQDD